MNWRFGYLKCMAVLFFLFVCFSSNAFAAQVQLAWNRSSDLAVIGYKVHYGTQSKNYSWVVDAGNSLGTTITGLSNSQTYYFAATTYSAHAESDYSPELVVNFITPATPAYGQISPSGAVALMAGSSQTFSITPLTGYKISGVLADNVQVGALSSYTFSDVTGPHTISALFTPTAFTITSSAGAGGFISPSGARPVAPSGNITFAITPNAGYVVSEVVVDGVNQGALTSYNFNNVMDNHTISATFTNPLYTIAASTSNGGFISPAGWRRVPHGANQTFTIMPFANYKLSSVKVDGTPVPLTSQYTFSNIGASHQIRANFVSTNSNGLNGKPISESGMTFAPVADAGPDQDVMSGSTVRLDGSNSTDSGSKIASYVWTQMSGPHVNISCASSGRQCTFKAPQTTIGTSLAFNLAVTNTAGMTSNDSCLVNVSASDAAPVANAGPNSSVNPYAIVNLNASGTYDPDGKITSYKWLQIQGPPVPIINFDTPNASFIAPDPGPLGVSLVFSLLVTDNFGLEARDQTTVNVVTADTPPAAKTGPALKAAVSKTVALDGSGSHDATSSNYSYRWKQLSGVPVMLSDPTAVRPTFLVPAQTGAQNDEMLFMLTVTDAYDGLIGTSKCAVTVQPR
jgi:hypothetical protein